MVTQRSRLQRQSQSLGRQSPGQSSSQLTRWAVSLLMTTYNRDRFHSFNKPLLSASSAPGARETQTTGVLASESWVAWGCHELRAGASSTGAPVQLRSDGFTSPSKQKAQDGLATAAWWGARRAEGVAGGRREASDRGREKNKENKGSFYGSWVTFVLISHLCAVTLFKLE